MLEDEVWQAVEHYYQSAKFKSPAYQNKIRVAITAQQAHKLGKTWLQGKCQTWRQVQTTVMTRAVYTQCKTDRELREHLLAGGDRGVGRKRPVRLFLGLWPRPAW